MTKEEYEQRQKELYDILFEEVKFLHEEQAAMSRCNQHFTGLKVKIAKTILALFEKINS